MNGTFLGGEGGQSDLFICVWEKVLKPLDFSRIVELGTWNGNFSIYFALWCQRRKAKFYTFDMLDWKECHNTKEDFSDAIKFKKAFLKGSFTAGSVLDGPLVEYIQYLVGLPGPTVLFCDNGGKRAEFDLYVPYLKDGDIVAVHDWQREIGPVDTYKKYDYVNQIHKDLTEKERQLAFFTIG